MSKMSIGFRDYDAILPYPDTSVVLFNNNMGKCFLDEMSFLI